MKDAISTNVWVARRLSLYRLNPSLILSRYSGDFGRSLPILPLLIFSLVAREMVLPICNEDKRRFWLSDIGPLCLPRRVILILALAESECFRPLFASPIFLLTSSGITLPICPLPMFRLRSSDHFFPKCGLFSPRRPSMGLFVDRWADTLILSHSYCLLPYFPHWDIINAAHDNLPPYILAKHK
jgi:hypothetical protein